MVGTDSIYPEVMRLVAEAGANVAAIPMIMQEKWEGKLGLLERAAENRVSIVAATWASEAGVSSTYQLSEDFTIMTPWKTRKFDGYISHPTAIQGTGAPGLQCEATLRLASSSNKVISLGTHLLDGRPRGDLVKPLL